MEIEKDKCVKVAIIGAGLIGKERIIALQTLIKRGKKIEITGIYDPYCTKKDEIENEYNVIFNNSLSELFNSKPEWIIVCTPHDVSVDLVKSALVQNFNVLVEKPLGRSYEEAKEIYDHVNRPDQLWVGLNYRFFEGISLALDDCRKGVFGKLVSINIVLGHGCHPEIKESWKLDPVKAGGGCLIDPGIHLIDLCRILSNGSFKVNYGWSWNGFWKTGIEEECHLLLDGGGFVINLQISIVRWRSTFLIEINGEEGYGIVTGRNRSYGKQKYIRGKRWGWKNGVSQKDSEEIVLETDGNEVFIKEIEAVLFPEERNNYITPCSGLEALTNMKLLEECRKKLNLS